MALHKPNSCCVSPSQCPIGGKINKAAALRMKITPKAVDVWFSSALITGEIAVMALPPQIAVHEEMRCQVVRSTDSHFPSVLPKVNVPPIENSVNTSPLVPASTAELMSIS